MNSQVVKYVQQFEAREESEMLSRKERIVLVIIAITCALGVVVGLLQWHGWNAGGYAWPPYWLLMIFTWDDAVLWGAFLLGLSLFVLWKEDTALFRMAFALAYVWRSFIEIRYDLNAQFSISTLSLRPWESPLPHAAKYWHLHLVDLYVVGQVGWTIVGATAALIFVVYLKKYLQRPARD